MYGIPAPRRRPSRIFARILPLMLSVALIVGRAEAQRAWSLEVDNDALNAGPLGARSDMDFSHGMRLSISGQDPSAVGRVLLPELPGCGNASGPMACQDWSLDLAQEIYTPPTTHSEPRPGDRAYAGWIGASLHTIIHTARIEHRVSLTAGVTGPPSLAGPTQRSFHRLIGEREPPGWGGQLGAEPTIDLEYSGAFDAVHLGVGRALGARLAPVWSAVLGTAHRSSAVGVEGAIEVGAPGVSRGRGRRSSGPGSGAFLLGALREKVVAGDLFLDGGFFRSGPRVQRMPWVRAVEVGAGVRIRGVGLEWRVIGTSREYATQPRPHAYAALTISR